MRLTYIFSPKVLLEYFQKKVQNDAKKILKENNSLFFEFFEHLLPKIWFKSRKKFEMTGVCILTKFKNKITSNEIFMAIN